MSKAPSNTTTTLYDCFHEDISVMSQLHAPASAKAKKTTKVILISQINVFAAHIRISGVTTGDQSCGGTYFKVTVVYSTEDERKNLKLDIKISALSFSQPFTTHQLHFHPSYTCIFQAGSLGP